MAYNAIASGSAVLTANADGLKAGLDKASKDVTSWGAKVRNTLGAELAKKGGGAKGLGEALGLQLASLAATKGGVFAGVGTVIGASLGGPIGAAIGGAIGNAVGAVPGMVGDLVGKITGTLDDVAKQGSMAQALGLTSEQFTGMAGVAKSVGEDTKEFIESLVTMGKLGTDAAAGTEEASKAFKSLGLNANDFIKLRADEQFFQIFDALNKTADPLQRTRALMSAFGEDGGKLLLPLLSKSSDELRRMAEGFAISGEQMKKAQAAGQAMKGLEAAGTKLWRGVAIAAAPLVEWFANFATRALGWLQPVFDWFGRAWQAVDDVAGPILTMIGDAIVGTFREMKAWAADAFGWVGDLPTIKEVVVAVFRATGISAALAWDTIKAGAGAIAYVAGAIIEQGGAIISTLRAVTDLAKELPDRPEWLDNIVNDVARADDKVREFGTKLKGWGKGAVEGWGNSAIEFDKWLTDALKPKAAGAEVGKGVAAGIKDEMAKVKLAGAVLAGSKEAYSLQIRNQLRGQGLEIDGVAKKGLAEQKKANAKLADGNKNTAKIVEKLDALEAF